MIVIRKLIAVFVAVLSVFGACCAIFYFFLGDDRIDETIQNAHKIAKAFSETSIFVDGFIEFYGRLPNETEFSLWTTAQPDNAQSARYVKLITSPTQFPFEIVDKFGAPPDEGYILQYWRGEWFEYYVSWVKNHTLNLEPSSFYMLKKSTIDVAAMIVICLLGGVIAYVIWPHLKCEGHKLGTKGDGPVK